MRWTDEQKTALTAEGHRLLVANAGTGKTTTVVGKIMWLLGEDVGVPRCDSPCRLDEIAAITFTEKAAYDLKRKLREEIRKSPRAEELLWEIETAALGTIHSFCGQLLRENALRMGIDPGFAVLDERDAKLQQDLLIRDVVLEQLDQGDEDAAELVRSYRLQGSTFTNGTIDLVREAFRDLRWHPNAIIADPESRADPLDVKTVRLCGGLQRMARIMCGRWAAFEAAENVRDFDSLILSARSLLTSAEGAAALESIRRRYRILIIDEFQDTDGAQRDIAYAIARHVPRPQLFLVGDPKQSIYRFRGADITVWGEVQADLGADAPALPLSTNFRSVPQIIDFVNDAAQGAMTESALALSMATEEQGVPYTSLVPNRTTAGEVEWVEPAGTNEAERRASEAAHVAQHIEELIAQKQARYADVALLYRTRTGLAAYKDALRARGIPFFDSSPAGLAERQEIQDIVNLLRVIANPADDLRMFGFLRSPFVGLRDEVLVRMRVDAPFGSYRDQAIQFARRADWFEAPEHPAVSAIERACLEQGLDVFKRARLLADRVPIDELVHFVLDETGYRQHVLLLEGSREALANIDAFIHLAGQYRDQTVGRFLELWDDRDPDDPGLPQGQLYSSGDDVVTFSTIHGAKGLEWPVVFLIDTSAPFRNHRSGEYWNDRKLGPVLCPKKEERGPHADAIAQRDQAHQLAEQARLLYVAATRAKDRLIVLAEDTDKASFAKWLKRAKELAAEKAVVAEPPGRATAQPLDLTWLDRVDACAPSESARPLPLPKHRFLTSATEQMMKKRDPEIWKLLYIHGVEPVWQFAPRPRKDGAKSVPERIRGDIIHGVLERIRETVELAEILEETIGEIDMPELESVLAPGTRYRAALEQEIERVLASQEWKWYVAGEHYRELSFLHLAGAQDWRIGAFDLYRPDGWIIDFKTHQCSAERVREVAESYRLQMDIYRAAAAALGVTVRTQLHFTHPGVVVELH